MASAWILKRMIIAYDADGWSGKLAGTRIDDKKRTELEEDRIFKVSSAEEVIELLQKYLHHYTARHTSIGEIKKRD